MPDWTIYSSLDQTPAGGGAAISLRCRIEGNVVRSAGLAGDEVTVVVDKADWPLPDGPASIDLKRPFTLWFGFTGSGSPPLVRLDHYYLRQADPVGFAVDDLDDGPGESATPTEVRLRLMTLPGVMRTDGRGGLLRLLYPLNPVLTSGQVDTDSLYYRTNMALVNLCVETLGFSVAEIPAGLNDRTPPGPLAWESANAVQELEALLARVGYQIALPNSGTEFTLYRLPTAADAVVLDAEVTAALAQPVSLAKAPGLRSDVVVVTSGETKTTVMTYRDLDALEWVYFDPEAYRWRNGATTPSGEIRPGDIAEFAAGPDPSDAQRSKQYGRLFRALRLTGDDASLRLVRAWEPMTFADGVKLSGASAMLTGRACRLVDHDLLQPVPPLDTDPHEFLGFPSVHSEAGVFQLPEDFVYVRMSGSGADVRAGAQVIGFDGLRIYFCHERNSFTWKDNYFVAAYRVTVSAGTATYTELTDTDLDNALGDPMSVKVFAPWLRRLVRHEPGGSPVEINLDALKPLALEIAKARGSLALAESGAAVCRGLLDIAPGACGGACSRVEWDLAAQRTVLSLNDHETPDGYFDELAAEGNRSFAAGASRWTLPGSAVGLTDVKSQTTPGMPMTAGAIARGVSGGLAGNDAESSAGSRGSEATIPVKAGVLGVAGATVSDGGFSGGFYARISAYTSLTGNRWSYQFMQARPVLSGAEAGTFVSVVGGYSNATHGLAYNLAESNNDGSGVEGNGINIANLPAGWTIQPVPVGAIVLIESCLSDATAKACFFYRENVVDGACPSSGAAGGSGGEGEAARSSVEGDVAALDMVLTDELGNVLLDEGGRVLLDQGAAEISLSDLAAFETWLTSAPGGTGGTGGFLSDALGRVLIGDPDSDVGAGSEQLINRILTDQDGQPLTDDAGRLLASA